MFGATGCKTDGMAGTQRLSRLLPFGLMRHKLGAFVGPKVLLSTDIAEKFADDIDNGFTTCYGC